MSLLDLTGRLLVASPHLTDGHFLRSVVLIVRHDAEGALGLTINRRTQRRLRNVPPFGEAADDDFPSKDASSPEDVSSPKDAAAGSPGAVRTDDYLHVGGPVEGPLVALHEVPGIGQPCGSGTDQSTVKLEDHPAEAFGEMSLMFDPSPVWLTADEDHIAILARRTDGRIKFVSGYAGWGPRQLDHEYDGGGWLHTAMDVDLVLGDVEETWETCVRRCGREVLEVIDDDLRFDDPSRN